MAKAYSSRLFVSVLRISFFISCRIIRIFLFFWHGFRGLHGFFLGGQAFSFCLNAFSEVYQQAYFYAGGFQVVDELGAMGRVEVFD